MKVGRVKQTKHAKQIKCGTKRTHENLDGEMPNTKKICQSDSNKENKTKKRKWFDIN